MSIINLKKTFENGQLVYFYSNNKIIECICLSELTKYIVKDYDNEDLGIFKCDKVKVITIYDIYKNIIYKPIQINLLKDPIKNGTILEKLRGYVYFFKTFMGAFIRNNKLNGIKYCTDHSGFLYKFLYNNISLEIINSIKIFIIYNNEEKRIHRLEYNKKISIRYKNYNDAFKYNICYNDIEIIKGNYPFYQAIQCHAKNLKIFEIEKYHEYIEEIHERRNDNNEIIHWSKYDKGVSQGRFFSNNTNPPFSKPLKKDSIELLNYYKKNVNNCTEIIKNYLKKEKEVHNRLLLNYKLEIINSK